MSGKPKKAGSLKKIKKPAKKRKYKINEGLKLYNKLSHEVAVINKKLKPEEKLPNGIRLKFLKDVYAHYKGKTIKQLKIAEIRQYILYQIQIINTGVCDVRLIPPSSYIDINYFEMDLFISDTLPDCVDLKVNAGEYGSTGIFNTSSYSYTYSGVQQIVENLRPLEMHEKVYPTFNGIVLVKPNRQDDDNPNSYYLEMQLSLMGIPISTNEKLIIPKEIKPKSNLEKEQMKQIKELMKQKISELTKKVPKELPKPIEKKIEPKKEKPIVQTKKQVINEKQAQADLLRQKNMYIKNMNDLYEKGLINKKEMQSAMKQALNLEVPNQKNLPKKKAKK